MLNCSEVQLADDGGDATLESFRLHTKGAVSTIEISRCNEKVWLVKVIEPNGVVNDIHFSADTEVLASIDSD